MDDIDRTGKELEYQNRDLADKVKYDESELREKLNELQTMKS